MTKKKKTCDCGENGWESVVWEDKFHNRGRSGTRGKDGKCKKCGKEYTEVWIYFCTINKEV